CVVFFFSSRRRHTRFSRDWSSDVCSSDLAVIRAGEDDDGRIGVVAQRRTDLFRAPPGWQQWIAPSENRQEGAAYASERLQRVEVFPGEDLSQIPVALVGDIEVAVPGLRAGLCEPVALDGGEIVAAQGGLVRSAQECQGMFDVVFRVPLGAHG